MGGTGQCKRKAQRHVHDLAASAATASAALVEAASARLASAQAANARADTARAGMVAPIERGQLARRAVAWAQHVAMKPNAAMRDSMLRCGDNLRHIVTCNVTL